MKKKLLAVILALALVLAFSSMALAADFTISENVADGKTFERTGSEPNYTYYSNADSITLTFAVAEGATGVTLDKTTLELNSTTPEGTLTVTKTVEGSDPVDTPYSFKLVSVSGYTVEIDADLYDGKGDTAKAYDTSGKKILVPTKTSKVYAKITVKDAADNIVSSDNYTVEGADKSDGAIAIDDFTTSRKVTVKMGSYTLGESKTFTLLRPTLQYVFFNDAASGTGNRLKIESGTYEYTTKDGYVESGWNPVYIRPAALAGSDATVTVKRGSTPLSKSGDWYYQRMSSDVYELTVTVSVGKDNPISQDYTIYLMDEDYSGPSVKAFEANETSTGRGDDYVTVVDQESKTVYVFLPDGESKFYANVDMNGNVESLKLGDSSITEGKWYPASTSTSKLTYKDEAGLEYKYTVEVKSGNKKYDDATLKSLTVKSGSRSNTASEVDIDFDPDVTEYAFPVTDRDVWLNIAAKANDSHATVFINGHQATSLTETKLDTDEVTEYEILVVAGDGVTTKTYTVTVNGSTGLLQSLSASNVVGLTPYFDPDVNTYTAYTAAGINSTYIVALAKNYSSDYVQISKANFNAYGQVTSYTALTRAVQGSASVTGELKTGTNIFRVDVLSSASATSAKASYYLVINVPTADPKCVVSSQKLYINGKAQTLSAYNIAGNNYLKLRDVAALLDGTVKEMKVDWDASKWTASMVMPGTFTKRGDELTTLTPPSKYALSTQYFTYNAKPVFPLAYNVTGTGDATGSNYVMLRDVASLLDFGVTYNPTAQTININTSNEYTPGL